MKKLFTLLLFIAYTQLNAQVNQLSFELNDSTTLTLTRATFNPAGRQIILSKDSKDIIVSIDKAPVFGTDASMPKYELTSARLHMGKKTFELNTSGMFDPWPDRDDKIPQFKWDSLFEGFYRIRGYLSIGSGLYFVEWTIVNDNPMRTMLTYDWSLLNEDKIFDND